VKPAAGHGRRRASGRPSRSGTAEAARRTRYYGVYLDELAAAFERYAPVVGAGLPRRPVRDDETDTITFFFNDWVLRPLRFFHLWSLWAILLMLGPAWAGLFIMHQSLAATLVLVVGCGYVDRSETRP
jgi:hypothetical protein